jgi:hypothetical protein
LEISDRGKPLTAARENFLRNVVMRIIEGWKKIDNERGYLNETTGQNLVVSKKQFGRHYIVLLFPEMRSDDGEGTKISPEYATESKAEAYAFDWMKKHPKGSRESE